GKKVSEFPPANLDFRRDYFPVQTKISTIGNHPQDMIKDQVTGEVYPAQENTYQDQYQARLAETYLIRAEAYLGKGQTELAAADINKVRERANATPITAGEVNIDYILDERLRELAYEEKRRLTLARLGLVYDRTSRFNEDESGKSIRLYHNLYPIPLSDIENNTEVVLEQNPGYTN